MNEQELKQLMTALQSSIGSFTHVVDRARNTMTDMASGLAQEDKAFEDRLKKLNRWNKEEDAERVSAIRKLHEHAKSIEAAQKAALDQQKKHRAQIASQNTTLQELAKKRDAELQRASLGLTDARKKADEYIQAIDQITEARKREWQSVLALQNQIRDAAKVQKDVNGQIQRTEQDLVKFSWKDAGKKVGRNMAESVRDGIKTAMSGMTVGNAIAGLYSGMQQVMATGGDNLFASASQQFDAAKLGLTPEDYIKMNAASRQTILASGGVSKQMEALASQSETLRGHFASAGDATKFTQGQMDILAKSGIRPTVENAGLLNGSFKKMQQYAGMTGEQFLALNQELSQDSDIQLQLRSASMEEREHILASNAARVAEYTAMGMTVEQAKNATKALAAVGNMKPIDRIKQAAKIRALGGAMGIAGANEAAEATLAGQNATDQQKEQLAAFNANMSDAMSKSARGSMGEQIVASKLQEKLGNKDTDANSVFNVSLAEGNKIAAGALDEQKKVPPLLEKLIIATTQAKAGAANPFVQATVGTSRSALDMFGTGIGSGIGSWAGTKMGLPTTVPGTPAAGGSKIGNFLKGPGGKLLGRAGVVGTAGVAGYEAYDARDEYEKGNITEKERNTRYGKAGGGMAGALAGMKMGAMAGGAIGTGFAGVGALPGAIIGGIGGAALGAWGGSELGGGAGGLFGSDETKAEKLAGDQAKERLKLKARMDSMVIPTDATSTIVSDKLQEKLGVDPTSTTSTSKTPVSPLTSSETRAESTSPIGLQLAKMEESNQYLKDLTQLSTKQLELAEKQLAATVVSQEDRAEVFKSLASGNKFMTSYSTLT